MQLVVSMYFIHGIKILQNSVYIFSFVINFIANARKRHGSIRSQGMQGTPADVQQLHHILRINPIFGGGLSFKHFF
jgi:hypothetical protein